MLARIRKQHGITQQDMAETLGIPVSTYNQYENGKRAIPSTIVEKICEVLGIDRSFFTAKNFTVCETFAENN